ncbi:MAG: hypothetical protein Q4E22_06545 [Coriobacteriia bacterium]|nr:hypothetical protein [Coriobacteriia bacterium]
MKQNAPIEAYEIRTNKGASYRLDAKQAIRFALSIVETYYPPEEPNNFDELLSELQSRGIAYARYEDFIGGMNYISIKRIEIL